MVSLVLVAYGVILPLKPPYIRVTDHPFPRKFRSFLGDLNSGHLGATFRKIWCLWLMGSKMVDNSLITAPVLATPPGPGQLTKAILNVGDIRS